MRLRFLPGQPWPAWWVVTAGALLGIGAHLGDVLPDIRGSRVPHGEIDRQYLDSTAIRTELGWEPKWDLDGGLRAAWEWYERTLG